MIGILGFGSLRYMQYLDKYTDILDKYNVEYEVLYWKREKNDDDIKFKGKAIPFDSPIDSSKPFYKKISGFLKYSFFMKKTIKQKKYNKLIVLTSQAAIPLYMLLTKKYTNRYIYDYRDVTKERFSFYKKMVLRLIEKSFFTAISSLGFKSILGESKKLIMSHNCSKIELTPKNRIGENIINISFWGIVRYKEYNKKICDIFGNDDRFHLTYHGSGAYKELKQYCNEKKYKNISFTGEYKRTQIFDFAQGTDIVHSAYPACAVMTPAVPVKTYEAMRYLKPILVGKGSYLCDYLKEYDVCYPIDVESNNLAEEILNWYENLDLTKMKENYRSFYEKVRRDDKIFEKKLIDFVSMDVENIEIS